MTYNGGVTGLIGGASYVGGLALQDDGWATTIKGTSVQNTGILYCSVGTNNSKVCDTSRNSPPQIPLPFTDDNIQDWKNEAVGGGVYTGNYSVDWRGATLGPKKITGNLLVNGGGTLTLNGTLWVQGTVTVTGGGKVVLPANFGQNSGVIISDSYITVSGGGSAGSGNSASYLFFVSTSKCPNDTYCSGNSAININGGAGAIAANAQSGNVALSGGANIRAVVGNSITVSGGSVVNYDSGLASPSFVSGPSGGFSITSWKEN
ncbi:MAG: hypothetical protein NT077_01835 [Candidatus Taylorbacteria bacterium]|nr:hypothetical protein [Candidatus Taylorbacteria bacterium]